MKNKTPPRKLVTVPVTCKAETFSFLMSTEGTMMKIGTKAISEAAMPVEACPIAYSESEMPKNGPQTLTMNVFLMFLPSFAIFRVDFHVFLNVISSAKHDKATMALICEPENTS